MNDAASKPPGAVFWASAAGVIACFLAFGALVWFVCLPARPAVIEPGAGLSAEKRSEAQLLTADDREKRLRALREHEQRELGSYGWVDKEAGVVRLPIGRAMELAAEARAREAGR